MKGRQTHKFVYADLHRVDPQAKMPRLPVRGQKRLICIAQQALHPFQKFNR
jgi:hypothetical protein